MTVGHEYKTTTLDSGLEVHTLHMPNARQNYVEIKVRAGNCHESTSLTGAAHYLEHMFGYGSDQWQEKDLLPYFQKKGGYYNYGTGPFDTVYWAFAFPHKTNEYLERMADVLSNPTFTQDQFDAEREPITTELLEKLSRFEKAETTFMGRHLTPGHRINTHGIGTMEHLEEMTYDDIHAFYKSAYTTKNMFLIVVGNVNHEKVVLQAETMFSGLSQEEPTVKMEPFTYKTGTQFIPSDSQTSDVNIWFTIADQTNPFSVQDNIVSRLLNNHLEEKLRQESKIVYTAEASTSYVPSASHLVCSVSAKPEKLEPVLEVFFDALKSFHENLNQAHIDSYIAQREEEVATTIDSPYNQGEFLSANIFSGRGYIPFDQEMVEAQALTPEQAKNRFLEILKGDAVSFIMGTFKIQPDIDAKIENLRRNLRIENVSPAPYTDPRLQFNK